MELELEVLLLKLVEFRSWIYTLFVYHKGREGKGRGGNNGKVSLVCLIGKGITRKRNNIFLPKLSTFGEIWLSTKLRDSIFVSKSLTFKIGISSSSYQVYPAHMDYKQGLWREWRRQPIFIKENVAKESPHLNLILRRSTSYIIYLPACTISLTITIINKKKIIDKKLSI